jgi:hypothetical protein
VGEKMAYQLASNELLIELNDGTSYVVSTKTNPKLFYVKSIDGNQITVTPTTAVVCIEETGPI